MQEEPSRESSGGTAYSKKPEYQHIIWMKVLTGERREATEMIALLMSLRVQITPEAVRMIEYVCPNISGETKWTRLVLKTVAELSFRSIVEVREVVKAAKEQGLMLCPPDTALALRAEYTQIPRSDRIQVMSEPVQIAGLPHVFTVTRSAGGIILDAVRSRQGDCLDPDETLVFMKSDTSTQVRAD